MVSLLMTPFEIYDGLYSKYYRQPTHESHLLKTVCEKDDGAEILIISKTISNVNFEWKEIQGMCIQVCQTRIRA